MPALGQIIRPPSEAGSFLLQVTTGCSADSCIFCGAYDGKPFSIKNLDEVYSDIEREVKIYPHTRRVFLIDGDALAAKNKHLITILDRLNQKFPHLSRISSYANGFNITQRNADELKDLYKKKLTLIYMGLESGSEIVLKMCKKKSTADEMIKAVIAANEAGIKSSVIVLLGLGGKKYSELHVKETIKALNIMQPRYLSFLSVMPMGGTGLDEFIDTGEFVELDSSEFLKEAKGIIKGLELGKTIFRSNHASNYLSLEGRFPKDKERLIKKINSALDGDIDLRPEFFRGL